ncbi:MAG: DUF2798 domain-containing protein [Psychromonas sp.]
MKKLPRKYLYPLMLSMVLPSMLMGMPAIMVYQTLPEGAAFFGAWKSAASQVIPSALLLLAVVAPTVRLFVSKILIEPE